MCFMSGGGSGWDGQRAGMMAGEITRGNLKSAWPCADNCEYLISF